LILPAAPDQTVNLLAVPAFAHDVYAEKLVKLVHPGRLSPYFREPLTACSSGKS
jgi:hypothetical protein